MDNILLRRLVNVDRCRMVQVGRKPILLCHCFTEEVTCDEWTMVMWTFDWSWLCKVDHVASPSLELVQLGGIMVLNHHVDEL